jgi:hypothetical protein
MHRKSMEADKADRAERADGDGSEYKVSKAVKMVRTCQSSLGQNGTRLGLLLLHVGPNGDGFGGQAFMEHYNGHLPSVLVFSDSSSSAHVHGKIFAKETRATIICFLPLLN